ncbi:MAG: hypothetical protein AB1402_08010 [Bacillota bacterium]|jgi:hypothetical protein
MSEANPGKEERWLIGSYRPTSLFSLRMTHATNKGGKTLLVPTPYSVKLALIDACFRKYGAVDALSKATAVYEIVKARPVRFRPPAHCIVQNTFIKIKQEERGAPKGIYGPTIAYREFCYYQGELEVALGISRLPDESIKELADLLAQINYLGKRGSFIQFWGTQIQDGALPKGYTCPEAQADIVNGGYGTTHYLDDFGDVLIHEKDGFERINSYGTKPSALGKYRVCIPTLLPYRYESSSKHYTYFRRIE